MTAPQHIGLANAPAVHFDLEPFATYAQPRLAVHPLFSAGICARPECSRDFTQTRSWQFYCCAACRTADEREFRRIGTKVAPALLAWRIGKYEPQTGNQDLRALSRAGRNFVSGLASDWFNARRGTAQSRRDG